MKRALPFVIIAVVLAGAVALTLILLSKKRGSSGPLVDSSAMKSTPEPVNGNTEGEPLTESESPIVKPNVKVRSPVVLEEYGDYQCPPCGLIYPVLKEIEAEYGNQLRIEFHHFPLTKHKNAIVAARAAEAARNQKKFWEMHDRLYSNQIAWAEQEDPRPIFISYARELGLNVDRFIRDMDSPEVDQRISADVLRATAMGVTGTPTIFIDKYLVVPEATNPDGLRRGINMMLEKKAI